MKFKSRIEEKNPPCMTAVHGAVYYGLFLGGERVTTC